MRPSIPATRGARSWTPRSRLVGINTALAGIGLGLAVPINPTTLDLVATLIRDGRVRRAYLGVIGSRRPLTPLRAGSLGQSHGVGVVDVVDGSPAAIAGLRPTDTILSVDATPVAAAGDLQHLMTSSVIDRPVVLRVLRGSEVEEIVVVPAELV
jgi:S1-C subfamily serine protease